MSDFTTVSPESVGIPSGAVSAFVNRLLDAGLNLHSLLVLRHGKLAAEAYWKPFTRDRKHRMYSISKTFTSLAVGRMITEGKLKLDDKIVDYFPDKLPEVVHPWMAQATVRDMLMMADCHFEGQFQRNYEDWIQPWFDTPPDHIPGTIFSYNTTCTNILCVIVERISGMPFLEYLRPVFAELGVSEDIRCLKVPGGYSFAGSGVIATPRELAKVGMLFLNKGRWNDKQLVDEAYMTQATTRQIDNYLHNNDIEHQQGYGYQVWCTRNNGFHFYGMGCQMMVGLPEQDMLVICTGDTQGTNPDTSVFLSAIWDKLLPAVSDTALPEDPGSLAALHEQLNNLKLPVVQGDTAAPMIKNINGVTYRFEKNRMGIEKMRFDFLDGEGSVTYTNKTGEHVIRFGLGWNKAGIFPETHYSGVQLGIPKNAGYEYHASAAWPDAKTLLMVLHVTDDYLGRLNMNATFDVKAKGTISVLMENEAEGFLYEYRGFGSGAAI